MQSNLVHQRGFTFRSIVSAVTIGLTSYCWYYIDPDRTQGFWDVCA